MASGDLGGTRKLDSETGGALGKGTGLAYAIGMVLSMTECSKYVVAM